MLGDEESMKKEKSSNATSRQKKHPMWVSSPSETQGYSHDAVQIQSDLGQSVKTNGNTARRYEERNHHEGEDQGGRKT